MDANEQIYASLQNDPALTALVGDSVWNCIRPEGEEVPALTFQRISTEYAEDSLGLGDMAGIRYQLDSFAMQLPEAAEIINAARAVLRQDYAATTLSRRDIFNTRTRIFRVSCDISIWTIDR